MQDDTPATVRNSQSIFLAGRGPRISQVTPDIFASASANLLKNDFTGVLDRYEESMVVLEEQLSPIFGNIDLSFVRANITDKDIGKSIEEKVEAILDSLPKELAKRAIEKNFYDLKLYKMANDLLDIKISTIEDFENRLESFKYRCGLKKLDKLASENAWEKMVNEAKELAKNKNANVLVYLKYAQALSELERYEDSNRICEKCMDILQPNPWIFVAMIKNHKALDNLNICNNLLTEIGKRFPQAKSALSVAKDVISN
jgi:tetratricopeptide (TPR) repeat protein